MKMTHRIRQGGSQWSYFGLVGAKRVSAKVKGERGTPWTPAVKDAGRPRLQREADIDKG